MGEEVSRSRGIKSSRKDAKARHQRKSDAGKIEPGMNVEATGGDLGEADVSKPKVVGVARDEQGNAEKLIVRKGIIFKKKLEIPADRVESVDRPARGNSPQGKVKVDVGQEETQSLKASGKEEELLDEAQQGWLDETERVIPTHEGLRELETLHTSAEKERAVAEEHEIQQEEDQAQPGLTHQHRPGAGLAHSCGSCGSAVLRVGDRTGFVGIFPMGVHVADLGSLCLSF